MHPNETLKTIDMTIRCPTATTSLGTFLSAVPGAFPRVENVIINLRDSNEPVQLCHIAPLFRLTQLQGLIIRTTVTAGLSDNDYDVLGKCLPGLRVLGISPDPELCNPPLATLLALSNIAVHCRCIQQIEIFVDISQLPSDDTILHPFSASLDSIFFGPSTLGPLDYPEDVGYVLCRMLLWCRAEIFSVFTPDDGVEVSEEIADQYYAAKLGWNKVARTMRCLRPLLDATKASLREGNGNPVAARIAELEADVRRKDARIAYLEESLKGYQMGL